MVRAHSRRGGAAAAGVLGVVAVIAVAVFGSPSSTTNTSAPAARSSTTTVRPSVSSASVAGPVTTGRGWTAAGISGPVPAAGTCHLQHTATGEPLPDPKCTPGAVDQAVTAKNIHTTVCRKGGYTASVRPPESMTESAKKKISAAYRIPYKDAATYELDHLVELNVGGSSDVRNLWPEPNTFKTATKSAYVHNDKDAVEAYTFHAICAGTADLQRDISKNWTTTVAALRLPPIPAGYTGANVRP